MKPLAGKTLFISGASRGIGKAIALRAAADGANISVLGKTTEVNAKLPGTIYDTVKEVEAAGGHAIACQCDIRFEDQVLRAVEQTVSAFGGIDICVNNASAISLTTTLHTEMKRYDLMHQINARGTFLCSKACLPHLLKAENPHILMLSPPLELRPEWFGAHLAYTMAKYGMSLCVLGLAAEFKDRGVAVNALWPRTVIATAATQNLLGGDPMMARSRSPEIVSDAAHVILSKPSREFTGNFCIDEDVLRANGVTDFSRYSKAPENELFKDLFV